MTKTKNEIGLSGIEFVEFSSPDPSSLKELFRNFGFSRMMVHQKKNIELYRQGGINLLLNMGKGSCAETFHVEHGPCISSMGWRTKDPKHAFELAQKRGAKKSPTVDYDLPGIQGIGDSCVYFTKDNDKELYETLGFVKTNDSLLPGKGFIAIDHLTNNVYAGTMKKWSAFYQEIFEFTEVRYFDIKGIKTGLTSYALKSPCETFCIPINEGNEEKSQINEYLRMYKGPGVQHLAFTTSDIIKTVSALNQTSIKTLDIDQEYYDEVFQRVPRVTEDHRRLQDLNILVDGDEKGYLLQIFTENVVGPIFIEIIQRKNHYSFGEGNFSALFRTIEKDQEKRGVL